MRIGIYGGSFNPPHKMHEFIGFQLLQRKYIDKIIYVPTGDKYNKNGLINSMHRLKMLEIMTKNYSMMSVSDFEVKSELMYTYQTLDYFKNVYPNDEICFVCGSDNLIDIKLWKKYKYILDNYKILVIKRNNDDIDNILKELNSNVIIIDINSENISSTEIRNDLKNGKENLNVTINVLKYIKVNGLYR